VLRVRFPRAPATDLSGERRCGKVAAVAQTRHTVKQSVFNETLCFFVVCLGALILAAFVIVPKATRATANSAYVNLGSFGGLVLAKGKLTAHFPKLHNRRYEVILSGGTCSDPALGAGLIVISPKDWVLDVGLRATAVFSMPQSGYFLLLDLPIRGIPSLWRAPTFRLDLRRTQLPRPSTSLGRGSTGVHGANAAHHDNAGTPLTMTI